MIYPLLYEERPLCVFEPPPPRGDSGATYAVHLRLIGKLIVKYVLVIIELFSLSLTSEGLRAKVIEI